MKANQEYKNQALAALKGNWAPSIVATIILILLCVVYESATCVHDFPILNPPPTSHPISSLWIIPVHQPQASCILY